MSDNLDVNDHREIGKVLDLFHLQEEAMGSVFWHPAGWTLFRTIENYIRGKIEEDGYQEVKTPQLIDRKLWEASGHWEKYRENMFTTISDKNEEGASPRVLAIKPMNCPGHVQIFNQGIVSYRQLPMRLAEFGSCHRNEPSGALHGIMRVRAFTQDDAHIFCRPAQVQDESVKFIKLLLGVYKDFGFDDVKVKLSTRPEVRAGEDADWDHAEKGLADACANLELPYELQPGEGAFYGPKLEFTLIDIQGREWQCGTLQYDMVLPKRLGAEYVEEDGSRQNPVILHRAILGSIERFVGMLLEHHKGELPFWLCPTQVGIVPVRPEHAVYANNLAKKLKSIGVRVEVNQDEVHFNKRIKSFLSKRLYHVIVIGDAEIAHGASGTVLEEMVPVAFSVRRRGSKEMFLNYTNDWLHHMPQYGIYWK